MGWWQPAQPSVVELPAAALEVVGEAGRRRREQRLGGRARAGGPGSAARRWAARAAPGATLIAANGPRPSSPRMPSPSGSAGSLAVADQLARRRSRGAPSLWMPMCTWSASAAKSAKVGERALPAERLHDQVGVDAAEAGRIDLALRRGAQHAEVDALRGQARFAIGAGARGLAHEVGALLLQVAAHLARQRLDDAERHQRRRVALVAARRALAVAVRGTRCRSRRPRRSDRRPSGTTGQEMVSGPPKSPPCTRRNGPAGAFADLAARRGRRRSRTRARRASCPRSASSARQTSPAARRSGVERGVHRRAGRSPGAAASRSAQLVPTRGHAVRFARRLEAERRRSRDAAGSRRARSAASPLVAPLARGDRAGRAHERSRRAHRALMARRASAARDSDVRKTRTLARPLSSSAR